MENINKAIRFMVMPAALAFILSGCAGNDRNTDQPGFVRATQFGIVEGKTSRDGKTWVWLGIPFAKPPVGELRWKPPVDPAPWFGHKITREYTEACSQVGSLAGPPFLGRDYSTLADTFYKVLGSEDCLYLNIYRPATPEKNLPVFVFIHGGSNRTGGVALKDGSALARNANMVVVVVPYRLNYFGWISHPALRTGDPLTDSGNYALLDLIQGLKFIKNNIADFGGDPGNVTISGQSAGGQNVHALLVSPPAKGLFHKALIISAPGLLSTPSLLFDSSTRAKAEAKAKGLIEALLIQDKTAADAASAAAYRAKMTKAEINAYLRSKSASDIVNVQMDPKGGKFGAGAYTALGSVEAMIPDGTTLPEDFGAAIKSGNFSNVPMIISNTAEEGKRFTDPAFKVRETIRFQWMMNTHPDSPSPTLADLLDPAVITPPTAEAYDTYSYDNANALKPPPRRTTVGFIASVDAITLRYQANPGSRVYAGSFNWAQQPEPWKTIYGAAHGVDLPFIFGDFDRLQFYSEGFSTQNRPGRVALSDALQKSIAAFVRTGDPNNSSLGTTWPTAAPGADGKPKKLILDADPTNVKISITRN